jgi:hypothetical protein
VSLRPSLQSLWAALTWLKVRFRLRTLSCSQPPPQPLGAVGDKAHVSLVDVIGVMCEELGRKANLVHQAPYHT